MDEVLPGVGPVEARQATDQRGGFIDPAEVSGDVEASHPEPAQILTRPDQLLGRLDDESDRTDRFLDRRQAVPVGVHDAARVVLDLGRAEHHRPVEVLLLQTDHHPDATDQDAAHQCPGLAVVALARDRPAQPLGRLGLVRPDRERDRQPVQAHDLRTFTF